MMLPGSDDGNDPAVIARLREELAAEDLAEVIGFYIQDAADMLSMLRAAAAANDAPAWRRAAHRLAGGAGAVGAIAVERAARRFMAEAGIPADSLQALERLAAQITASIAGLQSTEVAT